MRRVFIAMILVAAAAAPVAAQDRLEDRVVVNALVGPGFAGDATVFNMRASAGIKANDWLAVMGEWGHLSKPNDTVISGQHINANALFTTTAPVAANLRPYATVGIGSFRTSKGIFGGGTRTDFATNLGAGVTYDVNRWLGVSFDYRRFLVDYDNVQGTNRYTVGLNVGWK